MIRQLQCLVLLFVVACSPARNDQPSASPVQTKDQSNIEKRIELIQTEAKRIDAANDAAEAAGTLRTRELPHWQFSGLLQGSEPVFLSAQLSQGQIVREESYYFRNDKLILVRTHQWWDVDDPKLAPEPPKRQDFYIENDQVIRQSSEVASSPPVTKTSDAPRSGAPFLERSRAIAQIILVNGPGTATANSLEPFPEAESVPR